MQGEQKKLPALSEPVIRYPKFHTAYGPKRKAPLFFPADEGRTKQSFKDECDINVIMKRYAQTGVLEHVRKNEGVFQDVTGHEFQSAMDLIANARTAFEELPAHIRDRFSNDPAELLDFIQDADNAEEAAELGLLSEEASARLKASKEAAEDVPASSTAGAAAAQSSGSPDEPAPAQDVPSKPVKPKK